MQTDHEPPTHDHSLNDDESPGDCTADCECSHCVVTVALSDTEHTSVTVYHGQRTAMRDSYHGLYLDNIFRPPISS